MDISESIVEQLPAMVKAEYAKLDAARQHAFVEEFRRKQKSTAIAYLCWLLLGVHYGYQRKWGMQVLYWVTLGGLLVWMIIDAFRIPSMIRNYNGDVAISVMRDLKILSAA